MSATGDVQVHKHALVESDQIGAGSRIWAFAHVMPGARIGADCNICDHTFIEGDVVLGDRVTVKSGVYLWDGLRVEDDVFIGPQATFANDPFPRSRQGFVRLVTTIRQGASIGAGAVILPGIEIGERAMVGAGAVVTRNVLPDAVVVGNPARLIRRLETFGASGGDLIEVPFAERSGRRAEAQAWLERHRDRQLRRA